jgi:hypothetical protein
MRTRSLSAAVVWVALTATTGSSLYAQIDPGARIRVRMATSPSRLLVGTVDSIWDNSLSLRVEDPSKVVIVPLDAISTLELSNGRHSLGRKGATVGGVVGLLTGLGVGIATYETCDPNGFSDLCEVGNITRPLLYAVFGAAAGIGAGGLVGARFHADTWAPVSVPRLEMAPVSLNRLGLTVSFRF